MSSIDVRRRLVLGGALAAILVFLSLLVAWRVANYGLHATEVVGIVAVTILWATVVLEPFVNRRGAAVLHDHKTRYFVRGVVLLILVFAVTSAMLLLVRLADA